MSSKFFLATLALSASTSALPYARNPKTIEWNSCPELNKNITTLIGVPLPSFQCGSLTVPLDYTDPKSEPLDLSLFRIKATKEPVLGTVLWNPGGPGGTAADNLPIWASDIQANTGEQWNIVSWDPRGTGKTIPFKCPIQNATSPSNSVKARDVGHLLSANTTEAFVNVGWDLAGQAAEYCASVANDTGSYIGTAFGARDMVEILDHLGEDGMLRYWGWSYGTALGSYFAAMFPERVDRMVLDGNLNPHDYQSGTYGKFLTDTDATFAGFLEACFQNKDDCALAKFVNANKTEDLLDVMNLALEPLLKNATADLQGYLTWITVKATVFEPLYFPATWPGLAETIVGLLDPSQAPPANKPSNISVAPYDEAESAVIGIRASDAIFRTESIKDYLPIVREQAKVSPGWSDVMYYSVWPSARWLMDAKEQYKGDFKVKTKHPILYVNGEFDPVTPLVNAYNGSATFEGSTVLKHGGYGHGIFADPSACVRKHTKAYFKDGVLPKPDTSCEPDYKNVWELAKARGGLGFGAVPPPS